MKSLLLVILLGLLAFGAKAQGFYIENHTNCDILIRARASDASSGSASVSSCNGQYSTNLISIPASGSLILTVADLTSAPATSTFFWTAIEYYDPAVFSCSQSGTPAGCAWGKNYVSDPNCSYGYQSSCAQLTPCNPCAPGSSVSAVYNSGAAPGGDDLVVIY